MSTVEKLIEMRPQVIFGDETPSLPTYYEGLADAEGQQCRRYFSYERDDGLVTGTLTRVTFTIAQNITAVWPVFKDFNLWQNCVRHQYSGVLGNLEGHSFSLTVDGHTTQYTVDRVIPPYVILMSQTILETGRFAGMGGTMVFTLSEHQGGTAITLLMQHDRFTKNIPKEEALAYWTKSAPGNLEKWSEFFIPTLRKLVTETA